MATVIETIGASGATFTSIASWISAHPNPIGDLNLYVGELIDDIYDVDAGTLALTSSGVSPNLYRWLRAKVQSQVNRVNAHSMTPMTSGSFLLTVNGQQTATIAYNATAATVQAALELLQNVGAGNVTCVATAGANLGAAGAIVSINWVGALASQRVVVAISYTPYTGVEHALTTNTQGYGPYRPLRHAGPRVYVRWTGTGDQAGIRIAENFFRMSGFGIICEDPQEVTGGQKWGVRVESDTNLLMNMYVSCREGGNRAETLLDVTGATFKCYYINGGTAAGAEAADATFINCIAQGSPYFRGASYGFDFDAEAQRGVLLNCLANDITRSGSEATGFDTLNVQSTFKVKAINCISAGKQFGFRGLFAFLVDPTADPFSPLRFEVPYQCADTSNSITPGTLDTAPAAARKANVDPRSMLGRPDIQDYRPLAGSFIASTGRDMSSIFALWTEPAGGTITPQDFEGLPRAAPPTNAGGIGWTIGPYGSVFSVFSTTAPTVEVKTIGATGRDYATIQDWLAATENQSLPYVNKILIGELYDDADFSTGATRTIARRAITDVAHYRLLRVATGHGFDPRSGAGVTLTGTGGTVAGEANLLEVYEDWFYLKGPILIDNTNSTANNRRALKVDGHRTRVDAVYARILAGTGTATPVFRLSGTRSLVTNCVARGSNTGTSGATHGFQVVDAAFLRVYCCVTNRIKGNTSGIGFHESSSTNRVEFSSCIATDCTTGYSHATVTKAPTTQSFCISSDATAEGVGAQQSITSALLFVDAANGDYRNLVTSPALKRGSPLIVARLSTDFIGESRYAPVDCGAYEGLPITPEFGTPQFVVSRAWMKLYEFYLRDGTRLLFSDQSEPVVFRGRTYSSGGFDESNVRGEAGMRERTFAARGPTSSTISKGDLAAGKYRGARMRTFLLGRYAFAKPNEEQLYIIGDVEFDADAWGTDFLSMMNLLENNAGRQMTVGCPLEFGGEECGKDLTIDTLDDVRVSSTIQDLRRSFNAEVADVPGSYADDFFGKGKLTWLAGLNVRAISQVKAYTASTRTFVLEDALPFNIVANDKFQVQPGCRLRYLLDCVTKHLNGPNFGGDPLAPGTDKALSSPTR